MKCLLAVICLTTASGAQQPLTAQTLPDSPSTAKKKNSSRELQIVTFLQKRSLFFPDLAASPGALSSVQKFKLFFADSTAPSALLGAAFGAGFSQAADSPPGFGEGSAGYAKRFGADMARRASSEFFGTFLLASALHQDPRFFPQLNPTLASSAKYAISRLFITRSDEGRNVANCSGVLGLLLSESLANAYWPDQYRTTGQTFRRFGVSLGTRAASNMFHNYWPVIFKDLRRVTPGLRAPQNDFEEHAWAPGDASGSNRR